MIPHRGSPLRSIFQARTVPSVRVFSCGDFRAGCGLICFAGIYPGEKISLAPIPAAGNIDRPRELQRRVIQPAPYAHTAYAAAQFAHGCGGYQFSFHRAALRVKTLGFLIFTHYIGCRSISNALTLLIRSAFSLALIGPDDMVMRQALIFMFQNPLHVGLRRSQSLARPSPMNFNCLINRDVALPSERRNGWCRHAAPRSGGLSIAFRTIASTAGTAHSGTGRLFQGQDNAAICTATGSPFK